ncbi:MAG: hypothetical protein AB8G14_15450 [Ilumatobacter sp.]
MTTRSHEFGGQHVTIHAIGNDVAEVFGPALAHNEVPVVHEPGLTITCFAGDTSGVDVNLYARAAITQTQGWWLNSRYEVVGLQSDALAAVFQWPLLSLYDPVANEAIWYVDSLEQLQTWDRAAPARSILNWWLSSNDRHLVHAAAVGNVDGAVLLTGRGGSGESTMALSCIGSELRYVGDDYCAVSMGGGDAGSPSNVLSLYNSGKMVGADDIARLPHLEEWIVNPEELGEMKQLVFAHQIDPGAVLNEAPLRAIVLPTIQPELPPTLTEVSANEALRALAPTSLFQLPGTGRSSLRAMADLARSLPCCRLTVGPDLDANRALVAALLTDLGS